MPSLFDSDDEGRPVSRAPAKQPRVFKRPPVAPPTPANDAFPQLPLAGQPQYAPPPQQMAPPPQQHPSYLPQAPGMNPNFMVPAPVPQHYDPSSTVAYDQQAAAPQHPGMQQHADAALVYQQQQQYQASMAPQPQPAPDMSTLPPQQPHAESQFQPPQQQPVLAPVQNPAVVQNPSAVALPLPETSPQAPPAAAPPPPQQPNPMNNFLQQLMEPASPPHNVGHQPMPTQYQDTFGSPLPTQPAQHNNTAAVGPQQHTPSQGPAFASPRRSVSMKALPSIRMAHTPLGQVQLPSMPPVNLPALPDNQQRSTDDMAAWGAFQDLRKQLEDSHTRTLALHAEISKMQIAHEKEAANLQASVQLQLTQQSRELQEVTENYNSAAAKVDQLTGILARKADELMRVEQKLHAAELGVVSMAQKVAHVEDRVKLADHARQVAEVRTRELELSLEHATTLIHSLRRQLSVANDDKSHALAEQYATFETNRQQLIHFYAEREQFMLGSYTESLNSVQRSMQEYLNEREQVVEAKWEETYRTQLDHQKSLHEELVKRAEAHVAEIAALKEAHAKEMDKLNASLQREIRLSDERWTERERNLIDDIARRERELSEREQRMRVNLAQAEQDAKIALLSRESEMKAQFDRLLEEARREYEKDRERLSTAYREQIGAMAGQHMANERELERLHREKEREMAQRYRISNWEQDEIRASDASTSATSKTQDVLLAKMDKMQADQEARRLAMKTRFSTTPGSSGPSGSAPSS